MPRFTSENTAVADDIIARYPRPRSALIPLLHHLEHRLGVKAGSTTPDRKFTLEDVECLAACTEAPCMQVNYRYFHRVELDEVDELLDDLRAGKLAHEVPRHGTLSRVRQRLPEYRAGNASPERNVEPPWLARNRKANGDGSGDGESQGKGKGKGGKSS